MEGFPYYDNSLKNLPNLYDANEDNNPAMIVNVDIKNPLLCFISTTLSNEEQETYCISSELKVNIEKKRIANIKNKVKEENTNVNTWKMKWVINKISPFVCELDVILNKTKNKIVKRRIINDFALSYSSKTKLKYYVISQMRKEKTK